MALHGRAAPKSQQQADDWVFQSVQEFRKHLPSLCDQYTQIELSTTSHTVDFLPGWWGITEDGQFSHQLLLVSTYEEAEEYLPNELQVNIVQALTPEDVGDLACDAAWEAAGIGSGKIVSFISGPIGPVYAHPMGIIHKARHMPQMPQLVATKCIGTGLCLYNIQPTFDALQAEIDSEQPERNPTEGEQRVQFGPVGHLGGTPAATGQQQQPTPEGQGLCWSPSAAGLLLSTCDDSTVAVINIEHSQHPAPERFNSNVDAAPETGTTQLFSATEQLQGVNDAAWALQDSPLSQHVFAGAGQTGRVAFWDMRAGTMPVGHCIAHNSSANSLSFSNHQGSILITGGQDGQLCVLDVRRLANDGAAVGSSVVASLKGPGGSKPLPQQPVLQVVCSPHRGSSMVASVDAGARVMIWDLACTRPSPYTRYTQLRTIHAGHAGAVGDVSWSRCHGPSLLASVSQSFSRQGYMESDEPEIPDMLQVWAPSQDLL